MLLELSSFRLHLFGCSTLTLFTSLRWLQMIPLSYTISLEYEILLNKLEELKNIKDEREIKKKIVVYVNRHNEIIEMGEKLQQIFSISFLLRNHFDHYVLQCIQRVFIGQFFQYFFRFSFLHIEYKSDFPAMLLWTSFEGRN